jgi:hypothetical protein
VHQPLQPLLPGAGFSSFFSGSSATGFFSSSVLTAPPFAPAQPLVAGFFSSTALPAPFLPLQPLEPAALTVGAVRPAPTRRPAMPNPARIFFRSFVSMAQLLVIEK